MAEIIKDGIVKPEDVNGFASDIYRESQRLIALVEDIIHLSRLDEGGDGLKMEPVDLLELAGAKLDPACMLGTVGYARPAELVMVNGRVVVEHGRVLGMDEEQTRVRAQQLVDGMLQKAE